MTEKILPEHLQRVAYVYVRQSSAHQVRHHKEGQRRQYDLAARGRELGFTKIVVIDDDQGTSADGMHVRLGFGELLAAVCRGEVGAVLALEASRVARNNRDWHHLIDLCALTETLIIDVNKVYDPRDLNDRLLLGLQGSMAEFELGLFRQRAREAFEQKIRRGHAMWELPVGSGLLRRLLAMTEISFSNSLIESWWRGIKHQWLYLNTLDTVRTLEKLVAFYVDEHNMRLPHSAFRGQTPDEMYFGTGDPIPAEIEAAKNTARQSRMEVNRATSCPTCELLVSITN